MSTIETFEFAIRRPQLNLEMMSGLQLMCLIYCFVGCIYRFAHPIYRYPFVPGTSLFLLRLEELGTCGFLRCPPTALFAASTELLTHQQLKLTIVSQNLPFPFQIKPLYLLVIANLRIFISCPLSTKGLMIDSFVNCLKVAQCIL